MYPEYFGLREAPFSITPDPEYLFLSPRHREALAHLVYGAGQYGGFVQLTGEVGTGKTTVCRAFLEQLPQQVDVALILNPALTVSELLRSICEEFHIALPSDPVSNKQLLDLLNRYLLDAHAHDRRPVLMIDEAQNLSPAVLEQIRLLTNLETPKHKLLQIFLIGQPELRELLQQPGLRQVAQRITARYHLLPLDRPQTEEYIAHRLRVAGARQNLFSRAAMRRIHRWSGGIPRLINILCDRSLLGTYAKHRRQVTRSIVNGAARELLSPPQTAAHGRRLPAFALMTLGLISVAGIGLLASSWNTSKPPISPLPTERTSTPPELRPPLATAAIKPLEAPRSPPPATAAHPDTPHPREPAVLPVDIDSLSRDWSDAVRGLFARWGISMPVSAADDPCGFADAKGLHCLHGTDRLETLRHHNRPALLEITQGDSDPRYLLVVAMDDSQITIDSDTGSVKVPRSSLESATEHRFTLLWRPPGAGIWVIAEGASAKSIRWLRHALNQAPGFSLPNLDAPVYDQALRDQVIRFQRSRGLVADGITGPHTLIQLNTATGMVDTPRLD